MKPLKIAILWHFHQPVYYSDGELSLPWVRLHGVKDYLDLPELFREFPDIKQTVNLVPSLSMQIEDYVSGAVSDKIQRLTRINASELSDNEKQEILDSFLICNVNNMILPFQRFKELYEVADPMNTFDTGDWLDLQVWYNLTWITRFFPCFAIRMSRKRRCRM
jgi:alpha-amylase/alpha-mannosidase (GH57 family)